MPSGTARPTGADPENRYRTLIDSLDTGYCVIEMLFDAAGRPVDYRFIEINRAFERHSGMSQVLGKRMRELAPDHEQRWFDLYGRVATTGEPAFVRDHAQRLGDRWFEVQAFRIGAPALGHVAVLFQDVTQRQRLEEETLAAATQFRTLMQSLPCLAWTATADGRFDWFNDRTGEFSGLRPEELDGDGWRQLLHPEDLPFALARWQSCAASGEDFEFEGRLRRADDVWRWHLARGVPVRTATGAILRWVGTTTDIHDQRAARDRLTRENASLEAEVAERSQQLQQLWGLVPDLLVSASFAGRFLAVNPAWTQVLGLSEASLLERPFWERIHPDSVPECEAAIARMATGVTVRLQVRLQHADGSWRWFDWVAAPVGEQFFGIGRDITEERRRASELSHAQAALRQAQKMEAVGQLTGGIAHDFNNLLQVISGNLQLIGRRVATDPTLLQRVGAAREAVRRGARLAGQLLAFSRRQALEPRVVDVGRFVDGMQDMLQRAIGGAIEIRTERPEGLWPTYIDPAQIENAVLNLAINARDAMAGRGRLTIGLANVSLDAASLHGEADALPGDYVMLAVHDTGCGMSPEVMEQVFEPFFTTKPPGSGSGLGLSMVYGFVKQSGGHVRVDSELGRGTTFRLYLPRTRAELPADEPVAVEAAPVVGGREAVLLVEDDDAVRATTQAMLQDLGYGVLVAATADEACAWIEGGVRYDLLLTDVVMPGRLKSSELAALSRRRYPGVPVLYTSGYAEDTIVHDGRLDAGVDLLPKPYDRDALARRLRQLLDGTGPAGSVGRA